MGVFTLNTRNDPTVTSHSQHERVHHGEMFMVSHTVDSVAKDESVYIRHISGREHLHSLLTVETVGQWRFTSYAGTTYTGQGTVLTPINRRSDSSHNMGAIFYHTPVIDVLGTPRLDFIFGTGTNPSRVNTGQFSEDLESIFAPDSDVLVKLTNESGSNQYLSSLFNCYERLLYK